MITTTPFLSGWLWKRLLLREINADVFTTEV